MNIAECLEYNGCVYLACEHRELGWIKAEIQTSDYWVGGDEGGWTDNSSIYFDSPQQAQSYYSRKYKTVLVFEDEMEADEKLEELPD